jgi:transcription initiation factor TFIID subunit 12
MATQPMIRPNQIDALPTLDATQKSQYKIGLQNLWTQHDNNPEGSQLRNEAKAKIISASAKIMTQLSRGSRPTSTAAPQQQAQQAQQGQRPPQAAAQAAQGVQQGGVQGQQNAQQTQTQTQQQPQQPPQPQPQQPRPQPQQQQPSQIQQQAGQQDPHAQLQAKVKAMVQKVIVFPEPNTANAAQFEQYKLAYQQGLGTCILKRERARGEIPRLEALQNSGQNFSEDMQNRLNSARNVLAESARQVQALEQKNEQNKTLYNQKQQRNQEQQNQQNQQNQQPGQPPNGQAMANPQVNGAQAQTMQRTTSQQAQQPNVGQGDVKMEQGHSTPQPQFAQQPQAPTPQAGTPVQQQQMAPQQPQPQQQRPPQNVQSHGTPQSATQPQQQFPQSNMPQQQQQQQQRPPMPQQQSQQYGVPQQQQQQNQQQPPQYQQQTPQSAMPQNNMPNQQQQQQQQQPQRPQALTQRDAMAQAAQSYSQQQQQQQQQGPNVNQPQQPMQQQHGNMPNGMPFNQPQSAQHNTPTSGFPPPNQQMNSAQTKFPIPKDLRLDPRTQTPVSGPPSRPTMMGQGGMMNVPGVQKPAHFTLEGEGDHVLSKRKLDELVRQITGSVSPQDGLSPDVEEAVLSLTDNFVDNVITRACQLAKLRQGQTLEVKDVQMVLERNYGIRIPGYSLDELRTVRKFQPAPGWVGKVQAVQAGKVMGVNKDA